MSPINRREFLKSAAIAAGALALPGCTAKPAEPSPPPAGPTSGMPAAPTSTSYIASPATEATATAPTQPAASTPAEVKTSYPQGWTPPDMLVVRNGEPETLVRRAIAGMGGMERFVKPGNRVVIKPNICVAYHTYEYAATTNPWVVAGLVKLALEAGAAKVEVMDFPFGGTAPQAYKKSGIAEQVQAAGGEMVELSWLKFTDTPIPDGKDLKEITAYRGALDADVLINVPIAKTHELARLTLGMKNMMGLIRDREYIHRNMGERLADLLSLFKPDLTVIDAVRVLMRNGPTGGNLDDVKKLDTVIASPDVVAADSYTTRLFDMKPEDLKYITAGAARGLGKSDLSSLRIEEVAGD